MVEKVFNLAQTDEKAIEKILFDENLHYLHMVFGQNDSLPEHYSNSNVYMTVIRGRLTIALADNEPNEYAAGTMLKIPYDTKMNVRNLHNDTLELIVVKAPAPKM